MARRRFWAEMAVIFREAVNDVRDRMHQVFFGQAERASEPGAPMAPTPQMTTAELRVPQRDYQAEIGQAVRDGATRENGREMER
jgi:hypothetical protein